MRETAVPARSALRIRYGPLMFQVQPARGDLPSRDAFILYVEGPGDRSILREWSYRLLPRVANRLASATVILGGRQPARAAEHFENAYQRQPGLRALCILDRDDHVGTPERSGNLEFFTWSRRHIESYLLVPEALRRSLARANDRGRFERAVREHLPDPGDERAHCAVNAKALLGRKGPLARVLGRPLSLARIARATRETELHPDVHSLFTRLRLELGVVEPGPQQR